MWFQRQTSAVRSRLTDQIAEFGGRKSQSRRDVRWLNTPSLLQLHSPIDERSKESNDMGRPMIAQDGGKCKNARPSPLVIGGLVVVFWSRIRLISRKRFCPPALSTRY
jgi:hypothetical protein